MKQTKRLIKKKRLMIGLITLSAMALAGGVYYYMLRQYPSGIVQPFEHEINYVVISFDASKGIEFKQPTGTKISIPGNALIDTEGNDVKGEVKLKFREFHNSKEIFLSGIPMQMGEERDKYFSSGGMFELRTFQEDEELSLKKGSKVDVELANYRDTLSSNFKLYELENDEIWGTGDSFEVIRNSERDSTLAELEKLPEAPLNPKPDTSEFIFELISDYTIMPHLKAWKGVNWRLIESFGLTPEQAMRVGWNTIDIKKLKRKKYEINVTSQLKDTKGNSITYNTTLIAKPLLKGAELKDAIAQYEENLEVYKERLSKIEEETRRAEKEAALLNKFSIDGFGIYNIDVLLDIPIYANIEMEFDFEEELNPLINQVTLYMLLEDENGVLSFRSHQWNDLPLFESAVALAAVLPDGTVAYVSSLDFQNSLKNKRNSGYLMLKTIRIPYEEFLEKNTGEDKEARPRFI